jgi:hypothetical protein
MQKPINWPGVYLILNALAWLDCVYLSRKLLNVHARINDYILQSGYQVVIAAAPILSQYHIATLCQAAIDSLNGCCRCDAHCALPEKTRVTYPYGKCSRSCKSRLRETAGKLANYRVKYSRERPYGNLASKCRLLFFA